MRRHGSLALACAAHWLAVGSVLAQRCPPAKYPTVGVAVRIDACNALQLITRTLSTGCKDLRAALAPAAAAKVAAIEAMLADSLRAVFARQLGFVRWTNSGNGPWTTIVEFEQAHDGGPVTLRLVLRDSAGLRDSSEALPFQAFATLSTWLSGSPANATVALNWSARADSMLSANDGLMRNNLVKEVLSKVPLERFEVQPNKDGNEMWAILPIRDRDISAPSDSTRPQFEWRVDTLRHGAPPTLAPGAFQIGNCLVIADARYKCRMLQLTYGGGAPIAGGDLVTFFLTASIREPTHLYVVAYRPAKSECALRGIGP